MWYYILLWLLSGRAILSSTALHVKLHQFLTSPANLDSLSKSTPGRGWEREGEIYLSFKRSQFAQIARITPRFQTNEKSEKF